MIPEWLPEITHLNDYDGDWNRYIDGVYTIFHESLMAQPLQFSGKRVGMKRHPIEQGREATFWHLVSEGRVEADRTPDLRRCERIAWPRAILDNAHDECLKIWTEIVRNDARVHIWCEGAEYLFVLADRGDYVLPWTAYPVPERHYQRKLQRRWEQHATNS